MSEPAYITLKEAAAYLQGKGLPGQTLYVVRKAVADGRLAAIKDGRSWRTTPEKVDEYEKGSLASPESRGCSSGADL